jgi:hypothetical protein
MCKKCEEFKTLTDPIIEKAVDASDEELATIISLELPYGKLATIQTVLKGELDKVAAEATALIMEHLLEDKDFDKDHANYLLDKGDDINETIEMISAIMKAKTPQTILDRIETAKIEIEAIGERIYGKADGTPHSVH